MKSIILLSVFVTISLAVDFTTSPSGYTAEDGIATWAYLGVTTGTTALTAVSFVVTSSGPDVEISYPGGLTYTNIGNIAASSTGYGNFQILSNGGNFTLFFNVSYTKTGIHKWAIASAPLYVYVPEGGPGGTGKRSININLDPETGLAFPVVQNLDSKRQILGDISIPNTITPYLVSSGTWLSVELELGTSALQGISYTASPSSSAVFIGYPVPGSNYVGDLAAHSVAYPSFEVIGPAGVYTLSFNVSYSKNGAIEYILATKSLTILAPAVASSTSGLLSGIHLTGLTGISLKKGVEFDGTVANGSPSTLVGFIVGVTVGCVAAVVGVAVIAALVYVHKRSHSAASF